ncbi:MAG: glycoside hydrolase family 3 N-terminal domain-containing protein [Candidatus Kapaibacterium sp.]
MIHLLAQSIFPRLECSRYFYDKEYSKYINNLIDVKYVGGFVIFDGTVDEVYILTRELQKRSEGSLLFAADCEDGVTMRFKGGTEFPNMWALGSINDLSVTYTVAQSIALEMKYLGLHWNLAPVVDVNINPNNPIINTRSFGEDVKFVAKHTEAYLKGIQDVGIIACAKHFPGHGDTDIDSHSDLPILNFNLDRINQIELPPFKKSISSGVLSIMTAHLSVPIIDESNLPASLSYKITTELLRNKLGFNGVVITDAMDMKAITKSYSNGKASLMAYVAGADILETMPSAEDSLTSLIKGFKNGQISEERVYESSNRILKMKKFITEFDLSNKDRVFTIENNFNVAIHTAKKSIKISGKIVKPESNSLLLAFSNKVNTNKAEEWISVMFDSAPEAIGAVISDDINDNEVETLIQGIKENNSVILGLFIKPNAFTGYIGFSTNQFKIIQVALNYNCAIMNFGNPYLLKDEIFKYRIDAYSTSEASIIEACEVFKK